MRVRCAVGSHSWRGVETPVGPGYFCDGCGKQVLLSGTRGAPQDYYVRPVPPWPVRDLGIWLGAAIRQPSISLADGLINYVKMGRWLHSRGLTSRRVLHGREAVHDLALRLTGDASFLYLEFGVYKGTSLRYWSERAMHPDTILVGFDSFEGLSEPWRHAVMRGAFDTGGRPPSLHDPRVQIVAGWFEESLSRFQLPEHDLLVANIDCDLYSSTRTVLRALGPHLKPGSLLLFDELNDVENELRALDEFLDSTPIRLEPLARSRSWAHWLFRVREDGTDGRATSTWTSPRSAGRP